MDDYNTLSDKITQLPVTQNCDEFEDVIPVEEVKKFIEIICGRIMVEQGVTNYITEGNDLVKFIEDKAGDALLGADE